MLDADTEQRQSQFTVAIVYIDKYRISAKNYLKYPIIINSKRLIILKIYCLKSVYMTRKTSHRRQYWTQSMKIIFNRPFLMESFFRQLKSPVDYLH